MTISKIYKNGQCIKLAHKRERRANHRPTWPYYLAMVVIAVGMAWIISVMIFTV